MDRSAHTQYLDAVRKEIAERRQAIDHLQAMQAAEQRRLDALLRIDGEVSGIVGVPPLQFAGQGDAGTSAASPAANGSQHGAVRPVRHADVAEQVLREAGRPMKLAEIIAAIEAKGHPLPEGKTRRNSAIYSAMERRPSVFAREGGFWAIRKDPKQGKGATKPEAATQGETKIEVARRALREMGGRGRIWEIIDKMAGMGFKFMHGPKDKRTYNAMSSSLTGSRFFRSDGEGMWELVEESAPKEETQQTQPWWEAKQ